MEKQTFKNHVRVHPVYHYFAVPVSLALIIVAGINVAINFNLEAVLLMTTTALLHVAIFLSRDYAKKNQDRIIRSELRLRYFQLTKKSLAEYENELTVGQLLALRFASDEEFLELLSHPQIKQKQPNEIKKQIIQWNADLMRV